MIVSKLPVSMQIPAFSMGFSSGILGFAVARGLLTLPLAAAGRSAWSVPAIWSLLIIYLVWTSTRAWLQIGVGEKQSHGWGFAPDWRAAAVKWMLVALVVGCAFGLVAQPILDWGAIVLRQLIGRWTAAFVVSLYFVVVSAILGVATWQWARRFTAH